MSTISKSKQPIKKNFQLKKVGHTWGEVTKFGNELIANLGDDIFKYKSKEVLLFHILKQISPVNKSLKVIDNNSIEAACKTVLHHFYLDHGIIVRVRDLTDDKQTDSILNEEPKQSSIDKFCEIVIHMDKIPSQFYDLLLTDVNKDLYAISELIKVYEKEVCIQKYINNNAIPKSHEERIKYDFYKRCLDGRNDIINYQLYGLKKRAIKKAKYIPHWVQSIFAHSEMFKDRPYRFAYPFSKYYFDYREIDFGGHRLGEFPVREGRIMQQLYKDNKSKFYKKYFKRIPVEQHFQNYTFYLQLLPLPLSKNRDLIFNELIKSFKARRWISFYAVALPQVEGLFSEMCSVIAPEEDMSQKSLTHKVNSVRPFHTLSDSYFDYYQYHIPRQRNKFAHTGYDEDFKLKSYDLLVDLSHLLEVFSELDNPLVKVTKLHKRRNFRDFISLNEFVEYFKLLELLKPKQKKEIKESVKNFEQDFLNTECSVDYTCYELMQDLPKHLNEFIKEVNERFKIDFKTLKISEINTLLKEEKTLNTFESLFSFQNERIKLFEDYFIFLNLYKIYLPSLRREIFDEFDKLQNEFGVTLKNIAYINTLISNKKSKETSD